MFKFVLLYTFIILENCFHWCGPITMFWPPGPLTVLIRAWRWFSDSVGIRSERMFLMMALESHEHGVATHTQAPTIWRRLHRSGIATAPSEVVRNSYNSWAKPYRVIIIHSSPWVWCTLWPQSDSARSAVSITLFSVED